MVGLGSDSGSGSDSSLIRCSTPDLYILISNYSLTRELRISRVICRLISKPASRLIYIVI
jgi:hypothetical protein